MATKAPVKDLSLTDEFKTALDLVAKTNAIKVIKTKEGYEDAELKYKALILAEKKLKIQWDELETVIEYKKLFEQKQARESDFKAAKKYIKDGPMRAYDDEQERILRAEEARQQAEAQRLADIETAKQVAEQKRLFDIAETARKAAEAEAAKARKAAEAAARKGNEEAAAKARQAADEARQRAEAEATKQAAARAEAEEIKRAAPVATVVLEKTHSSVSRRKVFKYRLTLKDGTKLLKADFTAATRIKMGDVNGLPGHLFVLSPVLLNEFIDSQGEAAAIPGTLEVKSEMV